MRERGNKPEKRGRGTGGGEKTWMKKTREGNKREREPTCGNKNVYTNYSALNTKRHCVAGHHNCAKILL